MVPCSSARVVDGLGGPAVRVGRVLGPTRESGNRDQFLQAGLSCGMSEGGRELGRNGLGSGATTGGPVRAAGDVFVVHPTTW